LFSGSGLICQIEENFFKNSNVLESLVYYIMETARHYFVSNHPFKYGQGLFISLMKKTWKFDSIGPPEM
jgi:hypothetical protein